MGGKVALFMVMLCMVVAGVQHAEGGITCGQVTRNVAPCIPYLIRSSGNGAPGDDCCRGVKSLANAAKTKSDRQVACNCLKTAATSIQQINLGKAASLPAKCRVNNIPYKINPSINCSKVR